MTYVITEPCIGVKDGTCVDVCPVDCIHTTDEADQFYIDPQVCIDCEACVAVCPVDAIFYEEDVPEQWKRFTEVNKDFFKDRTDEERKVFRTRTERD
ncbi:MAG: 4Fe-4S dicluster domain-containing protein [Chloroflexi bacterium]|nr:4Fe-4S dicluster domain-containing protein [Chloroflexota bacterium]